MSALSCAHFIIFFAAATAVDFANINLYKSSTPKSTKEYDSFFPQSVLSISVNTNSKSLVLALESYLSGAFFIASSVVNQRLDSDDLWLTLGPSLTPFL